MGIWTLVLIALGLAADAFAVSIINSMCYEKMGARGAVLTSLAFGVFQGVMPLLGFWAGSALTRTISTVDHWVAFLLLGFIGGKMIFDAIREWNEPMHCPVEQNVSVKLVLTQALATSIDALAVGVSFAALEVEIFSAVALIAGITFVVCLLGHFVGKKIGGLFGNWAQLVGGAVLIIIGIKILIEHLTVG